MAHSKTTFQAKWLEQIDDSGVLIGLWCRAVDGAPYKATCILCRKQISCDNSGLHQIKQHAKGENHKRASKLHFSTSQAKFSWKGFAKKVDSQPLLSFKPQTSSPSVLAPNLSESSSAGPSSFIPLTSGDCRVKAEAMWAMKVASSNYSFASTAGIKELFSAMFPDSPIASSMALSPTKVKYLISDGLGPYFLKNMIADVGEAYYTIHFDETTTNQVKKQMDVLLRYFSSSKGMVQVRFLRAIMLGHAYADRVSEELLDTIRDLKLPLHHLLSISCDGPNVNKSIKRQLESAAVEGGAKGLVDIGFCTIHVVHNAFRKALDNFGEAAENLCLDLFYFFKLSSASREDYKEEQVNLELDEVNFVRHVQSRWLTLLPAVDRVISQMSGLREYFLKTLALKSTEKSDRYKRICRLLNDDTTEVQLLFLQCVKELFDSFLRAFQVEGPMVHCLYSSLVDLVKSLLKRFVKADRVAGKAGKDLVDFDVSKAENHLSDIELEIGTPTRQRLARVGAGKKIQCLHYMKEFYIAASKYLLQQLPLKNALLRTMTCLHPDSQKSSAGPRYIKYVAEKMPCVKASEVATVVDEWKLYMEEKIPDSWFINYDASGDQSDAHSMRVDQYWSQVAAIKTAAGEKKYPHLSQVAYCALTLAHGNADCERSLSCNNRMLTKERTCLSESTINGLRHVKDAVHYFGGEVHKIPVDREMVTACKNAHSIYSRKLQEEKEAEESKKKAKAKKQAEQQEQEKLQKEYEKQLKQLKEDQKDLKSREKETEEEYQRAKALLQETQERLTKAIKEKDMNNVSLASGFLEVARKKLDEAEKELKLLTEKKRKIIAGYEKASKKLKK